MAATVQHIQSQKRKNKGKKSLSITYKGYFHLPAAMLVHEDFLALSGNAVKLLTHIGIQYNGRNNGDLHCARSVMQSLGWSSKNGLARARDELIARGWLIQTRQGGLNCGPSLYALTWQPIHDCDGKLDLPATVIPIRRLSS